MPVSEIKLSYRDQRNPVLRFGHLALESQLHDPLIVLDHSNESLAAFMSMDAGEPFKFYFSRTSIGRNGSTDQALYSVKERFDGLDLFTIHPSRTAKVSWKRTAYSSATGAESDGTDPGLGTPSSAVFNIKKSILHPPVYSAYRGSHSGKDQDPADPHAHMPFLTFLANEIEPSIKYKFFGKVMSVRTPTGNVAIDSVMAVEREAKLVVLGSDKMHDIYVFLQLGGSGKGEDWRWKNKYAPGQLIATASGITKRTANAAVLGPDVMEVQAAPGVDGRLVLAVVLSAITHLQVLNIGRNGTGVAF
ncbi:hypothetical protein BCR44DRAFT_41968 [Catenaria anguillulae PL171]|uniref:Uncharacterized protein n=1 Tax=Catenaria anguillulae PL171 TaxID=765915 RepID=A0A1Y2HYY9_9FUNG|nr:hypothetical protein BCR44DRAFT_41968 [Catenaria anguillulae PL171]